MVGLEGRSPRSGPIDEGSSYSRHLALLVGNAATTRPPRELDRRHRSPTPSSAPPLPHQPNRSSASRAERPFRTCGRGLGTIVSVSCNCFSASREARRGSGEDPRVERRSPDGSTCCGERARNIVSGVPSGRHFLSRPRTVRPPRSVGRKNAERQGQDRRPCFRHSVVRAVDQSRCSMCSLSHRASSPSLHR